jgi:hypothetical protein
MYSKKRGPSHWPSKFEFFRSFEFKPLPVGCRENPLLGHEVRVCQP